MLGPLVNALVIVICSLAGCFVIRGIPPRFEEIVKKAIGLCIVYVGIKGSFESQRVLLLIMSMVAGAVIGELINIDKLMNRLGDWAEKKLKMGGAAADAPGQTKSFSQGKSKGFSQGFVSASILFCTGSMAIVGSLQSGLQGNHETLFAKSILDGSISLVFSASLGIGVLFSAIPVLVYQGGIALASLAIRDYLTPDIIREMSSVGNLLVAALGFNFLIPEFKAAGFSAIKVANLIPAIFIPWIYLALETMIKEM
ncbi:membrane protein [Spirochaetia bacterium]|nr:membrane protein [Spirochaetia bacterium]